MEDSRGSDFGTSYYDLRPEGMMKNLDRLLAKLEEKK
jgi:hypothetical protein